MSLQRDSNVGASYEGPKAASELDRRNDAVTRRAVGLAAPRLMVSVEEAAEMLHIGRTRAYRLVNSGLLFSVKVGRNRLIPVWAIEELVERLRLEPSLLERF